LAAILLGIARSILLSSGQLFFQTEALPDGLPVVLLLLWLGLMLLFCPIVFEWLVHKVGFAPRDRSADSPGPKIHPRIEA
jgi:hypothetical protein